MPSDSDLPSRLLAANVPSGATPVDAWHRLRQVEGPNATVIDLYELVATPRGLAPHELPHAERLTLARSALPEIWPGFSQTEASERRGDVIELVDYDADWPRRYESWHRLLQSCLGGIAVRIEHVGSTSVPGLAAKPIVDIQVTVSDLADESRYVPQLERSGLQLRSRDDFHRYFRPYPSQPRDVHVHVCAEASRWEREHLLFRDYLRSNEHARQAYTSAKQRAAAIWADDRIAYTDAKTQVILSLMEAATGWSSTNT